MPISCIAGPSRTIPEMALSAEMKAARRLRLAVEEFPFGWDTVFITLTYAGTPSVKEARNHLGRLRRQMRGRFGEQAAVWRIELQETGVPHFHILYSWPGRVHDLTEWLTSAWQQIVGEQGWRMVDVRRADEGAADYISKPKPDYYWINGRTWGRWGERGSIS